MKKSLNPELSQKIINITCEMNDMLKSILDDVDNNHLSLSTGTAICLCGHAEEIKQSILEARDGKTVDASIDIVFTRHAEAFKKLA